MAVCPAHPCTKAFLLLLLVQFQCQLMFSPPPLLMVPFFVVFSQWRRPPLFVKFPDSYEDPVLSATTLRRLAVSIPGRAERRREFLVALVFLEVWWLVVEGASDSESS